MSSTPTAPVNYQRSAFHRISKIVGISDREFLEVADKIPLGLDGISLLHDVLLATGKSKNLLLCLEDILILQYGSNIEISHSPLNNPRDGQKIIRKNEIVDPSMGLNAANLRKIFVMIEALVFKCVHLRLESQSKEYSERTETYEVRVCRLYNHGIIDPTTKQLADELYKVRCQFAHSIRSIKRLDYLSKSLEDRWSSSNPTQPIRLKRLFLPDVYRYSEKLLHNFKAVQHDQIDAEGFRQAIQEVKLRLVKQSG